MPVSRIISNIINRAQDGILNLESYGLDDDHIPDIVAMIKNNKPDIDYLNLRSNNITDDSAEAIASLGLINLNISLNHLGDEGVIKLLKADQKLIWLDVSSNGLSDAALKPILDNQRLVNVNLSDNSRISEEMREKVRAHIKENLIRWEQEKAKQEQASIDERKDPTSCAQEARSASYLIQSNTNPLTTTGTFKLPADETKESKESPSTNLKKTNHPGG
jgi:Leucine Rich repeat